MFFLKKKGGGEGMRQYCTTRLFRIFVAMLEISRRKTYCGSLQIKRLRHHKYCGGTGAKDNSIDQTSFIDESLWLLQGYLKLSLYIYCFNDLGLQI